MVGARTLFCLLAWWLALLPASVVAEDDPVWARQGVASYFEGDFEASVVALKRALEAEESPPHAAILYFLGRSFRELGLRGLALHYLGSAERFGSDWGKRARLELVRMYFEDEQYRAALQVSARGGGNGSGGEEAYLVGLSAVMLREWDVARARLAEVSSEDPFFGYALYTLAQARAAHDDLDGAVSELRRILGPESDASPPLRNHARILLGKVLFLTGEEDAARKAFAKVGPEGAPGLEAMHGLLLTGAPTAAAAEAPVSRARPDEGAIRLMVRSLAAEEKVDLSGATLLRERLRETTGRRLTALRRLLDGRRHGEAMLTDLAEFSSIARRARWAERARKEVAFLPEELEVSAPDGVEAEFAPDEPSFFTVWDRGRIDPWLSELVALHSRAAALGEALGDYASPTSRRVAFWKFWRWRVWPFSRRNDVRDDELTVLALLAIRQWNLRSQLEDHLHAFARMPLETLATERRRRLDATFQRIRDLFLGPAMEIPEVIDSVDTYFRYKRHDALRLVDARPGSSTDPVVSLLGNAVDDLHEMRKWLDLYDVEVPKPADGREAFVRSLRREQKALEERTADWLREAATPALRAELVTFLRLEADNEAALSKLYSRRPELTLAPGDTR